MHRIVVFDSTITLFVFSGKHWWKSTYRYWFILTTNVNYRIWSFTLIIIFPDFKILLFYQWVEFWFEAFWPASISKSCPLNIRRRFWPLWTVLICTFLLCFIIFIVWKCFRGIFIIKLFHWIFYFYRVEPRQLKFLTTPFLRCIEKRQSLVDNRGLICHQHIWDITVCLPRWSSFYRRLLQRIEMLFVFAYILYI